MKSTLPKGRWSGPTSEVCASELAVNTMFILELLADRLAHSLRSPLGVLTGLINDLQSGYQVDELGLKDAAVALDKMLRIVDSVVAIAITRRPTLGLFCLSDVLDALGTPLSAPIIVVDRVSDLESQFSMDLALAQHAVRSLDAFLSSCLVGNSGERKFERSVRIERDGSRISWSLITSERAALQRYAGCTKFSQVAALVNSPAALGLLAAEAAMVLNGLSTMVRVDEKGEMQFYLVFSQEPCKSQALNKVEAI